MEKKIEIDIVDKYDFVEKYNEKKISKEMIEYMIKETRDIEKKEKIKIIIHKKCKIEQGCNKMIRDGLREEYNRSLKNHHNIDKKQIVFLFLGMVFIFLSTLIKKESIWKEILLISGWVPIWEMIELELFPDMEGRKRRMLLKQLLESEIIVEDEKNENS